MFKRTKDREQRQSVAEIPVAVEPQIDREPTIAERRAKILKCALEISGQSLEDAARIVANQAWHLDLRRLMHEGAARMLKATIDADVELSPFEWQCMCHSVVSQAQRSIKAGVESYSDDDRRFERRAAVLKAVTGLTRLTVHDMANRVKNTAYYLGVRSLFNNTDERLTALMERRQNMTDEEWNCLKIGVLAGLPTLIDEYLGAANIAPAPSPSDALPVLQRRARLLRGSILVLGFDAEHLAKLVRDVAAVYQLGDISECTGTRVQDAQECRLHFTEYQWKCFALAILEPARLCLANMLIAGGSAFTEANREPKNRGALVDGCLLIADKPRHEAAAEIRSLAGRLDPDAVKKLSDSYFVGLVSDGISPHSEIPSEKWRWFKGILSLAAGALKHELNNVNSDISAAV